MQPSRRPHPGPLPRAKRLNGNRRSWTPISQVMSALFLVISVSAALALSISRPGVSPSLPDEVGTSVRDELPVGPVHKEPPGRWRAAGAPTTTIFAIVGERAAA